MKLPSPLFAALLGACCLPVVETARAENPAAPVKNQFVPSTGKPTATPAKPAEAPKAAASKPEAAKKETHVPPQATADKTAPATRKIGKLDWYTDYAQAYEAARAGRKMLLMVFRDERQARSANYFEQSILSNASLQRSLGNVVRLVLPINTLQPLPAAPETSDKSKPGSKAVVVAKPSRLIDHSSFEFMYGQPGVAMIDLTDKKSRLYGKMVSAHPFGDSNVESVQGMQTILNLPKATVTQRALTYAVLMYASPISTTGGQCDETCCEAARLGSELMAQSGTVGHLDWGSRGNMVMSATGRGASEVAAMGGGGTLQQACIQCINLWQGSPAHWGIMTSPQTLYGYDIVRGPSGWFGTGVYGQ